LKNNFLLIISSTLFALVLGEVLVRIIVPIVAPDAFHPERFLFWSSPHFISDQNGATRMIPNESVRTVAIYSGQIEYDVKYQTNNLGFIDHKDYIENNSSERLIAFVGDSFTAGYHGGKPWVPKLRDSLARDHNLEIYNLGVDGTGIIHFEKILESFGEQIKFNEIVIVAIGGDFIRRYWQPHISDGEVRFCESFHPLETCLNGKPFFTTFDYNASPTDVLMSATVLAERYAQSKKRDLRSIASEKSMLFALLRSRAVLTNLLRDGELPKWQRLILEDNILALKIIRSKYSDMKITLIHIPTRPDVLAKKYLLPIEKYVQAAGIDYYPAFYNCTWSRDMYLAIDGHPNKKGYENIANCIRDAIT